MKKLVILIILLFIPHFVYASQTLTENEAQGIDITSSGAGGTATVSGINATDTQKGVATFNTADFGVSSGNVTIKSGGVTLTTQVTGTLPMANGGTAVATLTDGGVLLGNGSTDIQAMAVLANGSIIVGDGTTDPVALAAFTNSTGDVIHEAGGLEADVSAYNGLIRINGGATSNITNKAGLETALGDTFMLDDGDIATGVYDFGGATLEMPNGTDPDLTIEGQLSWDTNNDSLRAIDADAGNQVVVGKKVVTMTVTVTIPDQLEEASTLPIWENKTGFTFNITAIYSKSDTDNANFALYEINTPTDFTTTTLIENITIATDGTSVYYNDLTSGIDHTAIETTHLIVFDNGATDCKYITFTITGWLDANVI